MASSMTALGLEQIRRRKGVSLQQIADSTKIGTFFLEAIESEDFGKLPGGVFNRSYIRQYAAAIGIPEQKVLQVYTKYEQEQERKENSVSASRAGKLSRLRWLASLVHSTLFASNN